MRAIVFGSKGYIGKHLVNYLRSNNYELWKDLDQKIDITESKNLKRINWNVDYVFLFAGKTGTSQSFLDYKDFINTNEIGLLNILDSIRNSPYNPKIIFPSSRLVYKGSNEEVTEESEKETKTVYALNKLACEKYLSAYSNYFGINYTIFRISVPYGNILMNDYSYGTIGNFIKQAKLNKKITLYGDGMYSRTFTYIENLIQCIVKVSEFKASDNEIFNIPGQNLTLYKVASLISSRFNCGLDFVKYPENIQKIESGSTIFNCDKISRLLPNHKNKDIKEWINSINF